MPVKHLMPFVGDEGQILKPVVRLVPIAMVDLHSFRDRTIRGYPYGTMLKIAFSWPCPNSNISILVLRASSLIPFPVITA